MNPHSQLEVAQQFALAAMLMLERRRRSPYGTHRVVVAAVAALGFQRLHRFVRQRVED